MKDFLLSIIIPTKNRQFYCLQAVEQILNSLSDNVEVIVQDNSDNNDLENYFREINSNRVVYNYHGGVLSFVDNFNEALQLAQGEYICMIGDDDGVLPIIEKIARYAKKNNLDAFVPGLNVTYSWPSNPPFIPHAENGYLYITPMSNKIHKLNEEKALKKLLSHAFQDYQKFNVPRLYHGLVKFDILHKINEITGNFFGGLTPDMYMSVSLSVLCKNVHYCNFPITISGMCQSSGSANSATGAHTGKLSDAPHFIGHNSYKWNSRIPNFYSVETIWAETGLHAIEDMNLEELTENVNYTYLLAILKMKYPQFENEIYNYISKYKISSISINLHIWKIKTRFFLTRVLKLFTGYRLKSKRVYSIQNIKEVEKYTSILMKKHNIHIDS